VKAPLASPFDAVASDYDATFGGWPAARLFRFRLIERIEQSVPPRSSLLDIGSGSGEDAVWLASLGFRVRGIDPSAGMIEVAREKARRAHSSAEFEHTGLASFSSNQVFDAVYSDFGAMNCVPLEEWAKALTRLVRPGGRVFLVLMGPRPLPERLISGKSAWTRRLQSEAPVDANRSIWVNYPEPGAIGRALQPEFDVARTETLGVVVPPPGVAKWPRRHPILFGLLAGLEMAVTRRRFLCRFSDHFLIELARR
jgi:SAM-dependent methyltransferase